MHPPERSAASPRRRCAYNGEDEPPAGHDRSMFGPICVRAAGWEDLMRDNRHGRPLIDRRAMLLGATGLAASAAFPAAAQRAAPAAGGELFAYVGSYTAASKGHGEGIVLLRVDTRNGAL